MNRYQLNCNSLFDIARKSWSLICLALLVGCSSGNPHPVKVDVAQQTLESTMESWKEGKTPDDLKNESPSVVVQDTEWSAGTKLLSYEIIGEGKPVDANLIAKVKLKLSNTEGKETEKTVTYVVGTSPVLTVFRDIMH
jgi:hypothetical protein